MSELLTLENLNLEFDGFKVLDNVNLNLQEGEIKAIIGPNGAGKTSIFKVITGLLKSTSGQIRFRGKVYHPIPEGVVRDGIVLIPQGKRVFPSLTVIENLDIVAFLLADSKELTVRRENVLKIFPELVSRLDVRAGQLSGGQQQMLALARGLMLSPRLILFDEPSLGLTPKLAADLFQKIKEINQLDNVSALVIEHNLPLLVDVVNSAYILSDGKMAQEVAGQDLLGSVAFIK